MSCRRGGSRPATSSTAGLCAGSPVSRARAQAPCARFAVTADLALTVSGFPPSKRSMRRFAQTVTLAVLCASSATHLHAQTPKDYDARTERLQGLTRADLAQLEPQLQAGIVGLIEFADTD